jgi:hypothetical protein
MIFWIILGILILLCLIPLGVLAVYNSEGFKLWLLIGPLRIFLFPKLKKPKEKKETPKKEKTAGTKKKPVEKEQKEGGSLKDFLPLLDVAKRLVASFFRKLRIRKLELKLVLAGDDPCDLAVNYGKTWAATGSLIPMLEELFVIRKRDVDVGCDFTAEETKIYAAADITILTGRLLGLAGLYGFQALREYLKILKKRKGEHQNESKSS